MAHAARRSVEDTWQLLERAGLKMPRDAAGRPFLPPRMPSYDDEEPLGFSFFRENCQDADFSGLTLPRTYFGRSLLENVSFAHTDLHESRMCWNDFLGCDFSGADLSRCDLRASIFEDCSFAGARLTGADLRHATFENCDFTAADLTAAIADQVHSEDDLLDLISEEQRQAMIWHAEPGPEPEGG